VRVRPAFLTAALFLILLTIGIFIPAACTSQLTAGNQTAQSQLETNQPNNAESATTPSTTSEPPEESVSPAVPTSPVSVVVAGYINHGPMQPTVGAIKEILSKYDDKVSVTWIDLATAEGQTYFREHGLTAHMNVIINGTSTYQLDGKTVDFEWFEGQQWTREQLDKVLATLINK
jgi:hypothetical protein